MLYRTKVITVIIVVGLFGQAAEAASLCKPDVVGIDLIEGAYNPPAFMPPDVEKYKTGGSWPQNLIAQGWTNLRAAHRPLTLVCRYKGRPNEPLKLPDETSSCELTYHGHLVLECKS